LGLFRGMQLASVAAEEMSIAITPSIRKLMKHHQLAMTDIDLWELHEFEAYLLPSCVTGPMACSVLRTR